MSDTKNVLIDGGERGQGKNVIAILEKYKIKKLDYVIATHPHSDHIGGIVDILYAMMKKETSLKINRIITCDVADEIVPTSKTYEYFLSDIDELDINFTVLEKTKTLSLGNASMKIVPSPYTDDENLNNESLVTIISHGKNDFVFTGDAEKAEEAALVGQDVFKGLGTVIYQAGHHGSETASTDILLDEIRPQYAVVSCGRDNSYGHPHKAAMNRLKKYTDRIFRTDEEGNILFVSDGRLCSYKTFR
jgi:competence protein ComEC